MKIILGVLLAITVTFAKAQPSVTFQEMLQATLCIRNSTVVDVTQLTVSPGNAGANMIWDFSTLNSPGSSIVQYDNQCPSNAYCSEFPSANRYSYKDTVFTFIDINNIDYKVIGSYREDLTFTEKVKYTTPKIRYQFPIVYGQTFNHNYSSFGDFWGDTITGTVILQVDGYGTLKTPTGTYNDVLRIKRTKTEVTKIPNGTTLTINAEEYEWIDNFGVDRATFGIYKYEYLGNISTRNIITYTTNFLSNNEVRKKGSKIRVFPNPAQVEINISGVKTVDMVQIYNYNGVLIKSFSNKLNNINIGDLPDGMYLVRIFSGENIYIDKFIKNK